MTDFEMLHIEQSDEELVARSEIDRRKRGIARALLPHLDVFTDRRRGRHRHRVGHALAGPHSRHLACAQHPRPAA